MTGDRPSSKLVRRYVALSAMFITQGHVIWIAPMDVYAIRLAPFHLDSLLKSMF